MRLLISTSLIIKKSLLFILCVLLILSTFIISGMSGATPNEEYLTKIDSELYEYIQSEELVHIMIKVDPIIVEQSNTEIQAVHDIYMAAVESVSEAIKDINRKYSSSGELRGQPKSQDDREMLASLKSELDNKNNELASAVSAKKAELEEEVAKPIKSIIDNNGGRITLNSVCSCEAIFAVIPGKEIIKLAESTLINNIYSSHTGVPLPALDDSAATVNADDVWYYEWDHCSADVAIIDTGIYGEWDDLDDDEKYDQNEWAVYHPYLDYKYNSEVRTWYSANFVGYWYEWEPDNLYPYSHHGTMVAGVVGSGHSTYRGLASNMETMINAKFLSQAAMAPEDLQAAYHWACGDDVDPEYWEGEHFHLDDSAEVINCSFGFPSTWSTEEVTTILADMNYYSYNYNKLFICAAGNEDTYIGNNDPYARNPSQAHNCISVGATDDQEDSNRANDTLASFTNFGTTTGIYPYQLKPDLVAPGVDITSTGYSGDPDYWWGTSSGTSFAAPHVAAAAAILRDNGLNAVETKAVLINTATKDEFHDIWGNWNSGIHDWYAVWDTVAGWGYLDLSDIHDEMDYVLEISSDYYLKKFTGDLYAGETITVVDYIEILNQANNVYMILKNSYGTQIDVSNTGNVIQVYTDTTYYDMELWVYFNDYTKSSKTYAAFPNNTWSSI